MANPEHVKIVQKGADAIKKWRRENDGETLELAGADLSKIALCEADLAHANLSRAKLVSSDLSSAYLQGADLSFADLSNAKLQNAFFWMTLLHSTKLFRADLSEIKVIASAFFVADLREAKFVGSRLTEVCFDSSSLGDADFTGSSLMFVRFLQAGMDNVRMQDVILGDSSICTCNLSHCVGLESVIHYAPSSIGIDTLIYSFLHAGNRFTPEMESFFLGAGVPKQLLEKIPEIIAKTKYYSCFVAYGEPDRQFAENLKKNLTAKGVTCWVYSMDSTPGEQTWREIGQIRREAEKMIVLCSARALIRDGVLKEIEEQIDDEQDKIVPISLDNLWRADGFHVRRASRDLKPFLMERNYADFSDPSKYDESLNRLLIAIKRKEARIQHSPSIS
jgi:hypothetical protein